MVINILATIVISIAVVAEFYIIRKYVECEK